MGSDLSISNSGFLQFPRRTPPIIDLAAEYFVEVFYRCFRNPQLLSSRNNESQADYAAYILNCLYHYFIAYAKHGLDIYRFRNRIGREAISIFSVVEYAKYLEEYYRMIVYADARLKCFGVADTIPRARSLAAGARTVFNIGIFEYRYKDWTQWDTVEQNIGVVTMASLFYLTPEEIEILEVGQTEQETLRICCSLLDFLMAKIHNGIPEINVKEPQSMPDNPNVYIHVPGSLTVQNNTNHNAPGGINSTSPVTVNHYHYVESRQAPPPPLEEEKQTVEEGSPIEAAKNTVENEGIDINELVEFAAKLRPAGVSANTIRSVLEKAGVPNKGEKVDRNWRKSYSRMDAIVAISKYIADKNY